MEYIDVVIKQENTASHRFSFPPRWRHNRSRRRAHHV